MRLSLRAEVPVGLAATSVAGTKVPVGKREMRADVAGIVFIDNPFYQSFMPFSVAATDGRDSLIPLGDNQHTRSEHTKDGLARSHENCPFREHFPLSLAIYNRKQVTITV